MRISKIAPRVTLNPRPYNMRFLLGLPLSMKRNTKLDAKLIKTNMSKMNMIVFNTEILKH